METIKILLRNEVDINIKDKDGKVGFDYLEEN